MNEVTHHGRTTAYRYQDGRGPTLLFVHGSGSDRDSWRFQFSALSYPMAALDLAGHGASQDVDVPPGPEALAAYGEDVTAVARAVDAEVLIGHSLGGAVGLHVTLETDFDPRGLVLVSSGAKLSVHPDILETLDSNFEQVLRGAGGFHDADPDLVDRSNEATRTAGQTVTYRDFKTCDTFDVRDRLGEIDVPVLAVTGEHDDLTFPWYHEYVADNVPRGEWTLIDDAAHMSMLEEPAAFNAALESFVDRLR